MGSDEDFRKRSQSPAFTPVRRVTPENSPETPAEKAPDPQLVDGVIDARRYTSAEFMKLEWERL